MGAPAWQPTTQDVANIVPERAQDGSGDFTASTVPTGEQVTALIGNVLSEVIGVVGSISDTNLFDMAALTVAVGAAAHVELGFTTDTAQDVQSKYSQLNGRYETLLKRLNVAVKSGEGESETLPVFGFPDRLLAPQTTWQSNF